MQNTAMPMTASATPSRSWWALFVLFLFYLLAYCDRQLLNLMVEPIRKDMALSEIDVGLLQGVAFSLLYVVVAFPFGWAADRFAKTWVIFCGILIWSASTFACGLSRTFPILFGARAGVGAGEAGLAPAALALLPKLFPADRLALATATYGIGTNLGSGIALAAGGALFSYLDARQGVSIGIFGGFRPWQTVFLVAGGLGLAVSLLILTVREPPRPAATADDARNFGDFGKFLRREWRLLSCHLIAFPLATLISFAAVSWSPAYLMRRYGLEIGSVGMIIGAATGMVGLLANLATGAIADAQLRKGRSDAAYTVQLAAMCVSFPAGLLAYLTAAPAIAIPALVVYLGTATAFLGTSPAVLNLVTPEALRGKMLSLYCILLAVTTALGPLIVATLTEYFFRNRAEVGYSVAVVIAVLTPFVLLALWLGRPLLRQAMARRLALSP
jgi:MFS family permease